MQSTITTTLNNLDLSKNRRNVQTTKKAAIFSTKLYTMLQGVEEDGHASIITWNADGKSFKMQDLKKFVKDILPNYFPKTPYRSFLRQLILYGFVCVRHGPFEGSYMHPFFVRDNAENLNKIQKIIKKKETTKPIIRSSLPAYIQERRQPPLSNNDVNESLDLTCRRSSLGCINFNIDHKCTNDRTNNRTDDKTNNTHRSSCCGKHFYMIDAEIEIENLNNDISHAFSYPILEKVNVNEDSIINDTIREETSCGNFLKMMARNQKISLRSRTI